MSPGPRKLRSGRRQFPGDMHGGTEAEWARVMRSPDVQRALQDPGIQQALYHNLQASVPGGMASVVPPAGPRPAGPPLRMQTGGYNTPDEAARFERLLQQIINDPKTQQEDRQAAQNQLNRMRQQQTGSLAIPGGGTQQVGSLTIPGGGTISGDSLSGLSQLTKPANPTNTAAAMGMGALMGLGTTKHQGLAALVGAGTAGILNYFVRKYGKAAQAAQAAQKAKDQTGQNTGTQGQGTGIQDNPGISNAGGGPQASSAQPPGTNGGSDYWKDATQVSAPEPWAHSVKAARQQSISQPSVTIANPNPATTSPGSSGPDLWMGTANSPSGNVVSGNGQDWVDARTRQPYSGAVINQTQITPASGLANAIPQTTLPTPAAAGESISADDLGGLGSAAADMGSFGSDMGEADSGLGEFFDFAKGGRVSKLAAGGAPPVTGKSPKAVLVRKPLGMPVPILHTTIVIAAKPKAGKKKPAAKQAGGVIRPARPDLLPPRRGPQNQLGERPLAHGRVQVPRGSGAAIRGKRFGGIY